LLEHHFNVYQNYFHNILNNIGVRDSCNTNLAKFLDTSAKLFFSWYMQCIERITSDSQYDTTKRRICVKLWDFFF